MRAKVISLDERRPTRTPLAVACDPGLPVGAAGAPARYIVLSIVALIVSAVIRPSFPVGDPAVFEYIGRAMGDGAHLYTDLWDNKLPSIYLVNELLWHILGAHYALHVFVESLVNAGTIALFAALLNSFGLLRWGPPVLAFGLCYGFVGGPFDQTEHYAVPLTIGAILLARQQRPVLAGGLTILASTFWIPSLAITLPPLFLVTRRENRTVLGASLGASGVLCAVIMLSVYGMHTMTELAQSWFSYQAGHFERANPQEPHHYAIPWLSPRYYIQSGLGVLLGLAAASWTRRSSPARTFALWWSAVGLCVVFALGKPSIHYFLILYAPLIMLLSAQSLDVAVLRSRPYFTAMSAACAVVMIAAGFSENRAPFFGRPAAIIYTGELIQRTFGPQAIGVMPWEIYLASDARPPNRFFLASGSVNFARVRDTWTHAPVVFVDAADRRFNRLPPPHSLPIECMNARMAPYVIWSARSIAGLSCVRT